MSLPPAPLPAGEAWLLESLVEPIPGGIASRVLARAGGGTVTLFAFDAGTGLGEHTSPADALVLVLAGALVVTLGGARTDAVPGSMLRLPGGVPHAVEAREPSRMLLVVLRDPVAP